MRSWGGPRSLGEQLAKRVAASSWRGLVERSGLPNGEGPNKVNGPGVESQSCGRPRAMRDS
eukprot:11813144-Alexandrium_andersonii.AAC.1